MKRLPISRSMASLRRKSAAGFTVLILIVFTASRADAQVYVQDSPIAAELLAEAEDRLRDNQPEEAARLVQKVLDEHGSKLLEVDAGLFTEARRLAGARLIAQPVLLQTYRQLHEPLAARLLQDAGHDVARLMAVHEQYPLTDAGLDAAMRLAGLELERGVANAAAATLDALADHPTLTGSRKVLWHQLSAVSAWLLGNTENHERHVQALERGGADRLAASIRALAQTLPPGRSVAAFSPLTALPDSEVPEQLKDPLWTSALGGAELFMRRTYNVDEGQLEDEFARGKYLNLMPVYVGGRLYINDGAAISALDPGSGRTIWETQLTDVTPAGADQSRYNNHWLPNGMDLNGLTATPRYVVAIGGFGAASTPYPTFVPVPSATTLASLDAETGKVLWQKTPDEVDADLTDSFWYGQPVVSGGRAYVTVRRRQRTQFQDAFLLAMDLATGRTLWRRHLGSVAISSRQVVPPLTHMTLDGSCLYVDTKLGTVACVSVSDGTVEWLNATDMEPQHRNDSPPRPWEVAAPLKVPGGVLVLDAGNEVVRLFHADTGRLLQTIPAQRWGWPAYIVRVGQDVVSVGTQIMRFRGADLQHVWTYDTNVEELRGRVSVTDKHLYVPMSGTVRIVSLSDGKQVRSLSATLPLNLLVLEGQVIATDRQGLASYSSWDAASRQLRLRSEQEPHAPQPLLSLAWLAMRTGRTAEMSQTLDKAVGLAVDDADDSPTRQAVFEQLLAMTRSATGDDPELKQAMFDRLALVARHPRHDAIYRMAYGQFLESQGQFAQAVDQYQWVLSAAVYRSVMLDQPQAPRPAGLEARQRLEALLAAHGRDLYAIYDAFAEQRLAGLRHEINPQALVELAEAYPLSGTASSALMLAAGAAAEKGLIEHGIVLLRRAQSYPLTDEQALVTYSEEARLLEVIGEPGRAMQALQYLAARYPSVFSDPQRAAALQERIGRLRSAWAAARHDAGAIQIPLSQPTLVTGQGLIQPTLRDPVATTLDAILLRDRQGLTLRELPSLRERWTYRIVRSPDVDVLSADNRRAILWSPVGTGLSALDTATGRELWHVSAVSEVLAGITPQGPPVAAERYETPRNRVRPGRIIINGRFRGFPGMFEEESEEKVSAPLLTAACDLAVAVGDAQGRIVVFDGRSGEVNWQTATEVRIATHLLMDDRHLFIAGLDREAEPLICVYELASGRVLHRLLRAGQAQRVVWMGLDPDGKLIVMSHRQVEAFDTARAMTAWKCQPPTPFHGDFGALFDGKDMVVQLHGGSDEEQSYGGDLLRINLETGRHHARMPVSGSVKPPLKALADEGQLFVMGGDRCMALDPDGLPVWRDGISGQHRMLDMAAGDRLLVILTGPSDEAAYEAGLRRLFMLDRTSGLIVYEQAVENPLPITQVQILGTRLFLTGEGITAVFGAQ